VRSGHLQISFWQRSGATVGGNQVSRVPKLLPASGAVRTRLQYGIGDEQALRLTVDFVETKIVMSP
jgi:hypothetical protein